MLCVTVSVIVGGFEDVYKISLIFSCKYFKMYKKMFLYVILLLYYIM